jgi:hypothetical protein
MVISELTWSWDKKKRGYLREWGLWCGMTIISNAVTLNSTVATTKFDECRHRWLSTNKQNCARDVESIRCLLEKQSWRTETAVFRRLSKLKSKTKAEVFLMTPCTSVERYRRFVRTCLYLHNANKSATAKYLPWRWRQEISPERW